MSAEKYVLTPSQFAKKEKITVETLKKRRQRGFYDGKFSVANGKFPPPDRDWETYFSADMIYLTYKLRPRLSR